MANNKALGVVVNVRLRGWLGARSAGGLLALGMVLTVAALAIAAFFIATSSGGSAERFTEFYALGPGGKAEDYPSQVRVGESATVILGVANHEGEDITYRIVVTVDGEETDSIDSPMLADGDGWEKSVEIVPANVGEDQKVEFVLYKDNSGTPYRSLHLFLDVEVAVAGAVETPQETPSPTPSLSPTPGFR